MGIFNMYGLIGSARLIRDVLLTKLFFKDARIVRHPVYIRGRRNISLGKGLTTGINLRIDAFPIERKNERIIEIGNDVEINDYVHIAAVHKVVIGNNVLIASKVFITDHNHGNYYGDNQSPPDQLPRKRQLNFRDVIIEDNVWLGEYVVVLPGTIIGKGAIIGAMSVVNMDIPPETIAVGIPARVIKWYNRETGKWEKSKKTT